jgi:hypothetical protein
MQGKSTGATFMTGVFDRQRAIFDFRKFVSVHRAWQGRHANFAAARAQSAEHVEISKGASLVIFIQLHPEHANYQSAIESDFDGQERFTFSKARWEETTKVSSVAVPTFPTRKAGCRIN